MNMDEYFVLFREYMLVQKPSSVNTRDSYLRDVSAFLRYLEGENITSHSKWKRRRWKRMCSICTA